MYHLRVVFSATTEINSNQTKTKITSLSGKNEINDKNSAISETTMAANRLFVVLNWLATRTSNPSVTMIRTDIGMISKLIPTDSPPLL